MAVEAIKDTLEKYKDIIISNPLLAAEIESAFRWTSYITAAGGFSNSQVLSELLYSSASLLQLINDAILRKAADIKIHVNETVEYLKMFLSVLEYTEVFSEFAAKRYAGNVGRWIIIASIQITKAAVKLVLLIKYNQGIQTQCPIAPLDRQTDLPLNLKRITCCKTLDEPSTSSQNGFITNQSAELDNELLNNSTLTLKRSGRIMRTLDSAPPRSHRTWIPPTTTPVMRDILMKNRKDAPSTPLEDHQVFAEILHIIRPVAHLTATAGFGSQAWTPYLISLGMDVASLKLLSDPPNKNWNVRERIEIGQRSFALLIYLLRSPFYDRFTKERILRMLKFFADHIPLFGRLIRPTINYLPEWQKVYFYVWGV